MQEMLEQGVARSSKSPWAGLVVMVEKKDGNVKICVGYHRPNSVTKMEVFPLPRIDDSLAFLPKSKQVEMEPSSRRKIAFVTHSGLYEFNVMPFRLVNAPSTFQRLMESVLVRLSGEKRIVYIADTLVPGAAWSEHLQNYVKSLRDSCLQISSRSKKVQTC